ncbi:MAG TPA: GYD domain-containing protein [Acidisphaera sp.]|nr:GYD domain-containing protein [Acidisphaera sp.]
MPKFLINGNCTASGTRDVQTDKGTGRQKAVAYACQTLGGKLDALYFGRGDQDVVAIVDMPSAGQVQALCLAIGHAGMSKTRAVPLLTVAEMDGPLAESVTYRPPSG